MSASQQAPTFYRTCRAAPVAAAPPLLQLLLLPPPLLPMLQLLLLQLLPSLLLLPLLMTTNDVVVVRKTLGHASPSARLTTRHSRPRLARLPDSGPKRYAQRQGLHFFLPSNDHYPYPK